MKKRAAAFYHELQGDICQALEGLDSGAGFCADKWKRDESGVEDAGCGCTRVLTGGKIFEKAAVNVSDVTGTLPSEAMRRVPREPR